MSEIIDLDARAHEIADDLIGTASSLHQFMTDEELDDGGLQARLSDLCFECDGCGWWASSDELHNDSGEEFCEECWHDKDTGE